MARRRDPTVKSILKALKIDPVREIAEKAMTLELGSDERIALMWELLPWIHYKPRPPAEVTATVPPGSEPAMRVSVVIGGDDT
jgi:hypothetical protein